MTAASYMLCIKPHVLRAMHFVGMFDSVAPLIELKNITSDHIKSAIEEAVNQTRKKEPDGRIIEAALKI